MTRWPAAQPRLRQHESYDAWWVYQWSAPGGAKVRQCTYTGLDPRTANCGGAEQSGSRLLYW